MMHFLVRWMIGSLSIFIVAHIVKGIEVTNSATVLVVALVLGIINAFLRPLIILVTLPIISLLWDYLPFSLMERFFFWSLRSLKVS